MEGKERGRERRLAGQRGRRGGTKIKQDAGSKQTVGEQWHERAKLEITHGTGTSEEAQNILTSSQTHTHRNLHTCKHTTHTHTQGGNREHSQRLYNKEKSVTSRTSKHNYHHSSAYTDWPLLPSESVKHNSLQTRRNHTDAGFPVSIRCELLEKC